MEELTQIKIPTITKRSNSYKMIIPKEVEEKIRFTCNNIWETEWSGILFYEFSGSFEDNDLTIICKDIFLMDVGTAGYTEFSISPDIIGYMADNPELLNYQQGIIHSHHNLGAFFSATDINTLEEEGKTRNHLVSLIVDNKGSYVAAITRRSTVKSNITSTISYNSFNNKEFNYQESEEEEKVKLEYFNLDIEFDSYKMDSEYIDRLNQLKDNNKNKKIKLNNNNIYDNPKTFNYTNFNSYSPNHSSSYTSKVNSNTIDKEEMSNIYSPISNISFKEDDYIDTCPEEYEVDKDIINSLFLQLITGSVVISNSSKIDPDKWVNTMESIFDRRFKNKEMINYFRQWAESYIEFLCWFAPENTVISSEGLIEDEITSIIAYNLIKKLESLKSTNKYIEEYKKILNTYIIH